MKVTDLKKVKIEQALIWGQSTEHADSYNGIRSTEELHQWADKFVERFGDAEIQLNDNGRIDIERRSNKVFTKWYDSYISEKGEFIKDIGHTN